MAWRWSGEPAVLMSRAIDETGAVQPTRASFVAERGERMNYHNNAIQAWSVAAERRGEQCLRVTCSVDCSCAGALALAVSDAAGAQQGPGLGVEVSAADFAPWDISIQPDGTGLPPGSGTAAAGAADLCGRSASRATAPMAPGSRTIGWSGGQGTLTRASLRCAPSAASGRTRAPCSTTSAARCPSRRRSR